MTGGGVQGTISLASLQKLTLEWPSTIERTAISFILGALDDKIELNREMNKTLEAMARALFKSWFVDFDPVVAKAAGRKPFGMDAATAALFPDSFEESELGPIPKGWRVSTIGAETEVVGGSTPSTENSEFWNDGSIEWATPRDFSTLETRVFLGGERRITEKGLAQISSGLLPLDTVLLSSRAPIGYLAITKVATAINQGFIAMKAGRSLNQLYVLHWTEANLDEVLQRAGGTTFAEISKSAFRPIPVIIPSGSMLGAFEKMAGVHFEKIAANLLENRTLAQLRDLLLPKLLSGEIRVRDAEKLVGEAT